MFLSHPEKLPRSRRNGWGVRGKGVKGGEQKGRIQRSDVGKEGKPRREREIRGSREDCQRGLSGKPLYSFVPAQWLLPG